jgi:hypothetical protein
LVRDFVDVTWSVKVVGGQLAEPRVEQVAYLERKSSPGPGLSGY